MILNKRIIELEKRLKRKNKRFNILSDIEGQRYWKILKPGYPSKNITKEVLQKFDSGIRIVYGFIGPLDHSLFDGGSLGREGYEFFKPDLHKLAIEYSSKADDDDVMNNLEVQFRKFCLDYL